MNDRSSGYAYSDSEPTTAHAYLIPTVLSILERTNFHGGPKRVFDLGCGNGAVANVLAKRGYDVTGVDPSPQGIAQAASAYPHLRLHDGSAYDDLVTKYGAFPIVLSLEVVEHVYEPRRFASTLFALVECGGTAIVSAPYHGYLKNLVLALSGRMDKHFTALWDYGHIKFWSTRTLAILLEEAGFNQMRYYRVGRIPSLAKSMIAVAKKPRVN